MRHFAVVLVVVVVGCSSMVWGEGIEDIVFYDAFESGDTSGWWAPARVGETGQKTCSNSSGLPIDCVGTGQDGDIQPGVAWPEPRFVDNTDGTVTDMLTGLVWLKNANCFGQRTWVDALGDANSLASGSCDLTDGSEMGDWRLPSVNELQSLIDYEYFYPALSNAAGTALWTEGDVFAGVQSNFYWSSTSYRDMGQQEQAWYVDLGPGVVYHLYKSNTRYVWPVRGGQ